MAPGGAATSGPSPAQGVAAAAASAAAELRNGSSIAPSRAGAKSTAIMRWLTCVGSELGHAGWAARSAPSTTQRSTRLPSAARTDSHHKPLMHTAIRPGDLPWVCATGGR